MNNNPKTKYHLTLDEIKNLLDYDEETGIFTWNYREGGTRGDKLFNKRFAGNIAGGCSVKADDGYLRIKIKGRVIKAHRLAVAFRDGEFPDGYVDHINGDIQDNRIINLRVVDKTGNGRNQKRYKNNKSGYSGVFWSETKQKWGAQIGSSETREHLGYYDTKDEAVLVRVKREKELNYHENHGRSVDTPNQTL